MRIDPLDTLFSEYTRRRAIAEAGGCERCLSPKRDIIKENGDIFPAWKQLQCSHFFGRVKKSVRWDEENAVGVCGACHMHFTAHPFEHADWFKERLGDKFDLLVCRANQTHPKPDKEAITLYYKQKLNDHI